MNIAAFTYMRWAPIALLLGTGLWAEDGAWSGHWTLRWNLLTERNGALPDYHDLRGWGQFNSPRYGPQDLQLHLAFDARKSFAEYATDELEIYRDRQRVQALSAALNLGGGRLAVGRQRPALHTLAAGDMDGLSWQRQTERWALAAVAGYQVPYWKTNTQPSTDLPQLGGQIRWQPLRRALHLGIALLRDTAFDGRARWRSGVDAQWQRGRLSQTLYGEWELLHQRWRHVRINHRWRHSARSQWAVGYSMRRATVFPLADRSDSLRYGGLTHEVSLRLNQRWHPALTSALTVRSAYGARPYRSEEVQLRWGRVRSLSVRLRDSWSPWRQIEQVSLRMQHPLRTAWSTAFGADATLFRWENARMPQWHMRARPSLYLHFAPAGKTRWSLRIEEELDEFFHLRTRAELTATHAL